MIRAFTLLSLGITCGVLGLAAANTAAGRESVKPLGTHEIVEVINDKDSSATFVEVTLAPGQSGSAHRHPGPVFVYVLEGEYELGIDDQPVKVFKAGETFYEPTNCLHRVSRNPSKDTTARLIAVVVHPRDAKAVAIPEEVAH
jgi:quercetin dioxygenase-like cupin family protein